MRLCNVFNNFQIVFLGNSKDRIHIGRHAVNMHRQNRSRSLGNFCRNLVRIHTIGHRININKNRDSIVMEHCCRSRPEGKGRNDNLVTRFNTDPSDAEVQRSSPAVNRNTVLNVHVFRPFLRQPFGLDSLLFSNSFGSDDLSNRGPVGFGNLWPRLN